MSSVSLLRQLILEEAYLREGGLKLSPEKRDMLAQLTPAVVNTAVEIYTDLLDQWNLYLESAGEKPVRAMRPVGSVSYYQQDMSQTSDVSYGDIDYLVAFPSDFEGEEFDRRRDDRRVTSKYENLFVRFLNERSPNTVDIAETLRGSTPLMVMLKLPNGQLVQVDTVVTFPRYSGWMEGRYTPEHGIKGYTIGNLYKALGDYLVMSISTEGVIVRSKMGQRVPSRFSRSKGVETENISTTIQTFLRDIAKYVIGSEEIDEDPLLVSNPGVDPKNVTISGLASGIKGLAMTLGNHDVYSPDEMLRTILSNYESGLRKNVESKRSRFIDDEAYQKLLKLNDLVFQKVAKEFGV